MLPASLVSASKHTAYLFALLSLAATTVTAQQTQTQPAPEAPLLNAQRMTIKGKVRPAETYTTGPIAGKTSPEACGFELMLKPGQKAIEARMVGQVRKTSDSGCEAEFDVGIPTKLMPTPKDQGSPDLPPSTDQNGLPPDIQIGVSNGNAPDLSAIFKSGAGNSPSARSSTSFTDASYQFSSGSMVGWVTDPINLQMTYLSQYVGWNWAGFGNCVTPSGYSRYVTYFWYDGWMLTYNTYSQYYDCNGTVQYEYDLFQNYPFCAAFYPPGLAPPTNVYYWPQQIQGWQDGTLYGNFYWIIGGAICSNLLTPHYQLQRIVN